ncbi:MAG TPA: putative baseplate assembly protein [Acidimicrobiales bacterium]|nr:putative baseplate assembly protein [Acidimicrobiales bacterium]
MSLPAPNLDDRRFQSLVDDAKRLVQQRCPEWSDHNVSDPGVTLIETFAYMVDQLLYRLNRVPDRNYVKFLELIGVRLFPPTAATTPVTFWLSAPQDNPIVVPAGVEVATPRADVDQSAVAFTTGEELQIIPCELSFVCSIPTGGTWRNHTDALMLSPFSCFSAQPAPDEVLLFGLSAGVPNCAVSLRFDCEIEGVGVDPEWPPLVWEAYDGNDWAECELDSDSTGGLNRAGEVVLHIPGTHQMSLDHQLRAGWVRARVTAPEEGQPFYSNSPLIKRVSASTVGGTTPAVQAELVDDEVLGLSEGVAGQRYLVSRSPVIPTPGGAVVEVSSDDEGWQEWTEVGDFSQSTEEDRHFALDAVNGEIVFGPVVRNDDGTLTQFGAVPPKGSVIRIRGYHTGGGRRGNIARGAIKVLRTTIPFITRVENRRPATGGVDGEDIEEAKVRGPIVLRTLNRAVTAEDYEQLARQAAPETARVHAVPALAPEDAGGVRVLVVPSVADDEDGRLSFERLVPPAETLSNIASALDLKRTIGARVMVEPPSYQGVTVVAMMRARPWADANRLQDNATRALYRYLHPISGGLQGTGWPFGRPVHVGEIYALLQSLPGVELVEDARLFAANPITGERGQAAQRVEVAPTALVFSYEHQIRVEGAA